MFRTCKLFAFALLATALLATALLVAGRPALAATPESHLGVPPRDLVTLLYTVGSGNPPNGPDRILPDGEGIEDYEIPRRKLLVITDIEWRVNAFGNQESVQAELKLKNASGFVQEVHQVFVPVDGSGFGSQTIHLTSGLVLDSSVDLVGPLPLAPGPVFNPLIINGFAYCILRGYLIDDHRSNTVTDLKP